MAKPKRFAAALFESDGSFACNIMVPYENTHDKAVSGAWPEMIRFVSDTAVLMPGYRHEDMPVYKLIPAAKIHHPKLKKQP